MEDILLIQGRSSRVTMDTPDLDLAAEFVAPQEAGISTLQHAIIHVS